jgi:hypothetical protein
MMNPIDAVLKFEEHIFEEHINAEAICALMTADGEFIRFPGEPHAGSGEVTVRMARLLQDGP